ncbi:DUF4190 domain-containing protein [Arthrobacter sp. MSA 4-2]|uniref:DUF4190 domain-containing protein n=1 Tax=Arthrobacter sp. MSA 4-2 TaxID=2794349 RepID=UPI0018E87B0C|nr:DUF4190 domain-containing protein [Arthrobacter sp. MSA 4-2]MBJ2119750.1 DUF4190 domain-containing protein [Arthrobacter sp. MSA 4-2]
MTQGYQQSPSTRREERTNPGRSLGIAGFVLSILGPLSAIGLILSIIAFVQSRKAGMKNGFALAGIIIGAALTVAGITLLTVGITSVIRTCAELGDGVHERNGITYTCNV